MDKRELVDKEEIVDTDINESWCRQVFDQAQNDPELFSKIDIESLLEKVENNDAEYLENKTLKNISEDVFESLTRIGLPNSSIMSYCLRLTGYRVVDRICDLRNGRMMRWIKIGGSVNGDSVNGGSTNGGSTNRGLTNGGILMSVKIENSGVQLLCRNNMNRFFNVKFDDCLIYQKLTMEEQLILMSSDYVENT